MGLLKLHLQSGLQPAMETSHSAATFTVSICRNRVRSAENRPRLTSKKVLWRTQDRPHYWSQATSEMFPSGLS